MEWLEKVGSGILGVVGGGVTGLFGVVVQRIFDLKKQRLDQEARRDQYAHEIAKIKAEGEMMQLEYAARTQVAVAEAQGKEAVADAAAFGASQASEPQRFSDPSKADKLQAWLLFIIDFIRGLVRPGLTMYLCFVTTLIYLDAHLALKGQQMSTTQAIELTQRVIDTILYLTTTCLLWWFGVRNKAAPNKK